MIKTVFEDVIKSVAAFRKEIVGSVSILETLRDNEELKMRLEIVQNYLDHLLHLHESNFKLKCFVIGEMFFHCSDHFLINSIQ